jgi:hypothetical protein
VTAKRTAEEIRHRTDPRWNEIPLVCMHCTHLETLGSQFGSEGWTCSAFPEQIPYGILANHSHHDEAYSCQENDHVYSPKLYTEEDTGRKWHYNADGSWQYIDEGSSSPSRSV